MTIATTGSRMLLCTSAPYTFCRMFTPARCPIVADENECCLNGIRHSEPLEHPGERG
jgi:hypothetical protein